jgi:hypothetical protein
MLNIIALHSKSTSLIKTWATNKKEKKREKIMNLEGTAIAPKACKQARCIFTEAFVR